AGGGCTVKPPARIASWPSGFVTVRSRGPIAAVALIARGTGSAVGDTTVIELTVMPAPKELVAPVWKFVPVTVTVRLAPCDPTLVTVRGQIPPCTVTRKVPSSAPSGAKATELWPTLSRSLPRYARLIVGGGGTTANAPARVPTCPPGFVTVTSRGPTAAVLAI